jgi:hypothetical protein
LGIKEVRVLVLEGDEFFTYVWQLTSHSHDTNEHWELAQVFVRATKVKPQCQSGTKTERVTEIVQHSVYL